MGGYQFANGNTGTNTKVTKIVISHKLTALPMACFLMGSSAQRSTLIIGDALNGSNLAWFNDFSAVNKCNKVVLYATTPPKFFNNSIGTETNSRSGTTIPNDCHIYVPDSSVDAYKNSGSNKWGAYSSRIHPISEYVES